MGATRFVRDQFVVDRAALELAAVFTVVLGLTAVWALQLGDVASTVSPPDSFGEGASGQATAGAAWAAAEIGVAIALLTLIFVYKRLPEFAQDLVKWNAVIALFVYFGGQWGTSGVLWEGMALATGLFTFIRTTNHFGIWWLVNNLLSIALALFMGIFLGFFLGVPGMILALILLTVYDHVFANKKTWMFSLGSAIVSLRIPVIFIRPSTLRFDWEDLVDHMSPETDDSADTDGETLDEDAEIVSEDTAWGLGTADLAIPAGFVAAVATSSVNWLPTPGVGVTLAVVAGIVAACFRLRHEMLTQGSGAGLPALSAGALAPYAVITVVSIVV